MVETLRQIEDLIKKTGKKIEGIIDVNTVIGEEMIMPNGMRIIPFTKITVGEINGAGEYGETKIVNDDSTKMGVSGLLVNVKPEGFLVFDGNDCRLMKVTDDPTGALIEKVSELVTNAMQKNE